MTAKKLSVREMKFKAAYRIEPNATKAAIAAGYSRKTAAQIGYQLLQKPSVAAAIAQDQGRDLARQAITIERVIAEKAKLAFANMGDYVRLEGSELVVDFSKVTRDQLAAVQEVTTRKRRVSASIGDDAEDGDAAEEIVETRFKLADKNSALDGLAKMLERNPAGGKPPGESDGGDRHLHLHIEGASPEILSLASAALKVIGPGKKGDDA